MFGFPFPVLKAGSFQTQKVFLCKKTTQPNQYLTSLSSQQAHYFKIFNKFDSHSIHKSHKNCSKCTEITNMDCQFIACIGSFDMGLITSAEGQSILNAQQIIVILKVWKPNK